MTHLSLQSQKHVTGKLVGRALRAPPDLHLFLWGVHILTKAFHVNILWLTVFVWVKSWLVLVVLWSELEKMIYIPGVLG